MPDSARLTRRRLSALRSGSVVLCALLLSSFSGCALQPSLSPRPASPPWQAEPTVPVINAISPDAPPGRGWSLRHPSLRFGGLSGMAVTGVAADGRISLTAVSDRGTLVRFTLTPDGAPDLTVEPEVRPLTGLNLQPLLKNRDRDSEEIVARADGSLLISFEMDHRLWAYPPNLASPPVAVALPDDFGQVINNGGLEGMALHPDGRLLLVQESTVPDDSGSAHGSGSPDRRLIRAWVGIPDDRHPGQYRWSPRRIAAFEDYEVSGATALADGTVLLIERAWSFPLTFHTRIRRLGPELWDDGAKVLDGPELFRPDPAAIHENYESLVVLPTRSGTEKDPHLFILSDNNFLTAQKTLLLDIGRLADLDGMRR